jgi:hypothetical protein
MDKTIVNLLYIDTVLKIEMFISINYHIIVFGYEKDTGCSGAKFGIMDKLFKIWHY